jgi:hypothetical protein
MAALPTRFDLWVRKARESTDPARQADLILGALVALDSLYFFNIGTQAKPLIARTSIAADECALVFTDPDRIEKFLLESPVSQKSAGEGPPVITSPTTAALKWCMENTLGLIINPLEAETIMVPHGELAPFFEAWHAPGGRQPAGFWIPNMTTEEEDFWQEHGL